ncbi:hypothetical protein BsWGS_27015 [Bradybaena similaris]
MGKRTRCVEDIFVTSWVYVLGVWRTFLSHPECTYWVCGGHFCHILSVHTGCVEDIFVTSWVYWVCGGHFYHIMGVLDVWRTFLSYHGCTGCVEDIFVTSWVYWVCGGHFCHIMGVCTGCVEDIFVTSWVYWVCGGHFCHIMGVLGVWCYPCGYTTSHQQRDVTANLKDTLCSSTV